LLVLLFPWVVKSHSSIILKTLIAIDPKQPTNLETFCFIIPRFNFNDIVGHLSFVSGL